MSFLKFLVDYAASSSRREDLMQTREMMLQCSFLKDQNLRENTG